MKSIFLVAAALVAVATAAVIPDEESLLLVENVPVSDPIRADQSDQQPDGSSSFSHESGGDDVLVTVATAAAIPDEESLLLVENVPVSDPIRADQSDQQPDGSNSLSHESGSDAAVVAVARSAAIPDEESLLLVEDAPVPVPIRAYKSDRQPDGSYSFSYESEDGSTRQETGSVKEVLDEENNLKRVIVVSGSYGYYNDQGNFVTVSYSADENGFQAQGDSIPTVPSRR